MQIITRKNGKKNTNKNVYKICVPQDPDSRRYDEVRINNLRNKILKKPIFIYLSYADYVDPKIATQVTRTLTLTTPKQTASLFLPPKI